MSKRKRRYSYACKSNRKLWIGRLFKRTGLCLAVVIFILATLVVIYCYRNINFFPITKVRLFVDSKLIDVAPLQPLVRHELRGNFFTLALNPIMKTLQGVDQVQNVTIQRRWPDSLLIYVDGYQPIAYWNQDKMITIEGYVFKTPKHMQEKLPSLEGPQTSAKQMADLLHAFNIKLQPLHLAITKFTLNRTTYSLVLSNQVKVIIGDHDLMQRLDRFVSLYFNTIARCEKNVSLVDLRYSNGLAVKWKQGAEPC